MTVGRHVRRTRGVSEDAEAWDAVTSTRNAGAGVAGDCRALVVERPLPAVLAVRSVLLRSVDRAVEMRRLSRCRTASSAALGLF